MSATPRTIFMTTPASNATSQRQIAPYSVQALVGEILSTSSPYDPPEDPEKIREVLVQLASYIRNLEVELGRANASSQAGSPPPVQAPDNFVPAHTRSRPTRNHVTKLEDINGDTSLSNVFRGMSVRSGTPDTFQRHFGKSSNVILIKFAMDMRMKITGDDDLPELIFKSFKRSAYWDVLPDLIEIYFEKINIYMPLLHRPTFTRAVKEGLHLHDEQFGGLMTALFLSSSSIPHGAWALTGLGVRYAQEMGAHRQQAESHTPTIETELWKRAYWALLAIDGLITLLFGRPRAIQPEDFDLEYPLEVDNEYWEDPKHPFVQPSRKPSVISGWVHYLKLMEILGVVHRGILLDLALNEWIDCIPEHVKWDKDRENDVFFNQSVMLHAMYYWAQIQVHKSYILGPEQGEISMLRPFPPLAICANAARSSVRILESQYGRGFLPIPLLLSKGLGIDDDVVADNREYIHHPAAQYLERNTNRNDHRFEEGVGGHL
ncbi:hypothetical protein D9758_012744 [Tetrapyrgos nigripes]|uniref:Xylanolytic transcriptional activator regulatory domain-containing protein n=1 Tax=Tetrapyrgos nigripes TaxID=182062 RepID=A0A8H5CS86_9AGAR|nr:hypothetical protein D9758_012744 [Tetrapyrgos nigripes]